MSEPSSEPKHDSAPPRLGWLRRALVEPSEARWSDWLLFAFVSYLILLPISFLLLWLGDSLNPTGMAVTRFLARLQAPAVAAMYPKEQRDNIVVLLYDQPYLDDNDMAWPISYADHADWLLRLASASTPPKAIIVDITFAQNRKDATLPTLASTLCAINRDVEVPVFLAGLPARGSPQAKVRKGLEADPGDGRGACFTLVDVSYQPDPVDDVAWHYPLLRSTRSAALAVAEAMGRVGRLDAQSEQMALVWGNATFDPAGGESPCKPADGYFEYLGGRLWSVVADFTEVTQAAIARSWREHVGRDPKQNLLRAVPEIDDHPPVCPYHRALTMSTLSTYADADLAREIGGRFVIIGANLPGYNDRVLSPATGPLPGAFAHAMALDNLLTYGADYKIARDWSTPSLPLVGFGMLVVSVVLAVHLAYRWGISALRRTKWYAEYEARFTRWREERRVLRTMLRIFGHALLWMLGVVVQVVLAGFFIGLIQRWTRVGTLPLVELVMMALTVETLGKLSQIREWLNGFLSHKREDSLDVRRVSDP